MPQAKTDVQVQHRLALRLGLDTFGDERHADSTPTWTTWTTTCGASGRPQVPLASRS
jgi:hypothetical protein